MASLPPSKAPSAPPSPDEFWRALLRYRDALERAVRSRIPARVRAKFGASDVVQEAYVTALRRAPSFVPDDDEAPLRWLTTIVFLKLRELTRRHAGTKARDARREAHGDAAAAEAAAPARDPSPASAAEEREADARVREAVEALAPDHRTALRLCFGAGMSDARAGEALGRGADAVRKLRGRAVEALAEALARAAASDADPTAPHGPRDGGRVGPYVLGRALGEGAMGRVYAARRADGTGPEVAVKVLHPEAAAVPGLLARFRDEARLCARTDGRGVVRVLDVLEADPTTSTPPAIVLERVDGRTLREVGDADGPVAPARWLRIARSAAAAVASLHAAGVVHRDLKPENLLVRPDDTVVVADLGLARALDATTRRTASGTFVGTRWYAAPEQFRGPRDAVGPAADVYVLALSLYELWTRRHPFADRDGAVAVDRAFAGPPPPASSVRPGLPRGADDVLSRALAPEPARRYADAGELADALAPRGDVG